MSCSNDSQVEVSEVILDEAYLNVEKISDGGPVSSGRQSMFIFEPNHYYLKQPIPTISESNYHVFPENFPTGSSLTFTGTATNGTDYTGAGDITILSGSTTGTLVLTMTQDNRYEPGNETIDVSINSGTISGATVGTPSSQNLTITDDDSQPTISINDVTQFEGIAGNTSFNFTVSLSNPSNETITVNYATADVSAFASVDYVSIGTTTLTFNPGVTSQGITVSVFGETLDEEDETFTVNLSSPNNATISDASGTGTITNDDTAFQPEVTFELRTIYNPTDENGGVAYITAELDVVSGKMVTVPIVFSGTANDPMDANPDYSVSSTDIIIAAGDTKDSVSVTGLNDAIEEGNETIIVNMGTPTNGVEDGVQQVTLTLSDDDVVAPTITSITRQTPSTSPTTANSVVFRVAFSEDVSNVDVTDFDPTGTSANATNVSGSGTLYDVTVSGGDLADFSGTVSLGIASGQNIVDAIGTPLTNTTPTGTNQSYVLDNAAPVFENGTPNTSAVTQIGFTLNVDLNEAGTAYYVVVANSAAAPTSTNVRNGQANGGGAPVS